MLVNNLGKDFTLRNQWTARGFHIVRSNVNTLQMTIGNRREYLEDHVAQSGGVRMRNAIPTKGIRRQKSSIVRKARWPGALLGNTSKYFISQGTSVPGPFSRFRNNSTRYVFERGRGRRRRIKLLYVLPSHQPVKHRYDFGGQVSRLFRHQFPPRFQTALIRNIQIAAARAQRGSSR